MRCTLARCGSDNVFIVILKPALGLKDLSELHKGQNKLRKGGLSWP